MQDWIDVLFPQEKLTPEQRENIRLAMTDRLLKDPKIQALFNMQIGVVDILGSFAKWGAPKTAEGAEKAKETPSTVAAIDQTKMIEKTFAEQLQLATKPLSELLTDKTNKKEPLPTVLLSNPKAIAEYNGGEIPTNITEMNPVDLKAYIASLNGEVRKIDAKILGMEQIKEWGMNFLANAPSFLVDFFKWLLSFDFIAKIFWYSGTKEERAATLDEELKQRRSLGILKEFGDVPDTSTGKAEGAKKPGESSGKIPVLRWVDLSGLRRDKLADFFIFTKEEGIDIETKEFWMGVFNDGKIVGKKDAEGKETSYRIDPIKEGDLKDNFKGLYEKLNGFKVVRDVKNVKNTAEQNRKKQEEDAKKAAAEKEKSDIEMIRLKPYADLYLGHIDPKLMEKFGALTIDNLMDGSYTTSIEKVLWNWKDSAQKAIVLAELKILTTIITDLKSKGKMEAFQNTWLKKSDGKLDMSLKNLYFYRRIFLQESGYTKTSLHISDAPSTSVLPPTSKISPTVQQVVAPFWQIPYFPKQGFVPKKAVAQEVAPVATIASWEIAPTSSQIRASIEKVPADTPITIIWIGTECITFDHKTQFLTYKGNIYHIELPNDTAYEISEVYKTVNNQIQFKPCQKNNKTIPSMWWPKPGTIDEFSQWLMTMITNWKYEKMENGKIIMRITKVV